MAVVAGVGLTGLDGGALGEDVGVAAGGHGDRGAGHAPPVQQRLRCPAFFHQFALSEDCLERLIHNVPYLSDDQLVDAFASAHSLGKRAWVIQAAIRAAVQVQGHDGLASVWGAAEQPKWHMLLTLQPHNGFLLTEEKQCDRAALARCVRLATHNAYLTLQSQLDDGNGSKVAAAEGASNG